MTDETTTPEPVEDDEEAPATEPADEEADAEAG